MKRLLLLIVQLLTIGLLSAQTDGYDPENPDEPFLEGYPHRLSLSASPENGGYFGGYSSVEIVEGDSMYIYAYPYSSFRFVCWKENGFVISTSNPVKYTMGTSDSELTAEFVYDPTSPADPLSEGYMHRLKLIASPSNAGYFNSSSTNYIEMTEGEHQFVYAYPRNGFSFVCWKKNGSVISTENPYEYVMGTENDVMTAQFAYNPANPGNPGVNYFNPATGEVIIDEFSSGSLSSVIANLVGNNGSSVRTISVTGRMSYWDGGAMAEYPTLTSIDFSRVSEYYTLASYAFDYDSTPCCLRTLYLPSSISYIQEDAFNGCDSLAEINCFAITPPEVDSFSLRGIPSTAIVYVPAVALQLYQADPFWRTLNIRPMDGNIVTLKAQLPPSINLADYAGMFVQLHNTQNGLDIRYAITDQSSFTFENLVTNTHYNLQVVNQAAQVFGRIDNIRIGENDTTVTFDSLSVPQCVSLRIKTPEGVDITDSVEIKWYNSDYKYICQDSALCLQLGGTRLLCSIKLKGNLALAYSTPDDYDIIVANQNAANRNTLVLQPLGKTLISGLIIDQKSHRGVGNARLYVHQRVNGNFDSNINITADANGNFSDSVFTSSATVKIMADGYREKQLNFTLQQLQSGDLGSVPLEPIDGPTVCVSYTYRESVLPGQSAHIQNFYDARNVMCRVYHAIDSSLLETVTENQTILRVSEKLASGDSVIVRAISKSNEFSDVYVTGIVDTSNQVHVTMPIAEYGGSRVSCGSSTRDTAVALLYNAAGERYGLYKYEVADTLKISGIKDGQYTLVSMEYVDGIRYPSSLGQFALSGLSLGRDYVQNDISIASGIISTLNLDSVPHFNDLRLTFFDKSASAFMVDKTIITAGDYLTVTAKVVIPDSLISTLDNTELVVSLPSSVSFISGSVMVNGVVSNNYDNSGNNVSVRFSPAKTNVIKLCAIPSMSGRYSIDGTFLAQSSDDTLSAQIGSAQMEVRDISINVPKVSSSKTVAMSGAAKAGSTVEIYDNGNLLATVTAKANNSWGGKFTLQNAYNLSVHDIYAKVTNNGVTVVSNTVQCKYDKDAIEPSKVVMHYGSQTICYDFRNPTPNPGTISYGGNGSKFTFDIHFNENNDSIIKNVVLYVMSGNGGWHKIPAVFGSANSGWRASANFSSSEVPVQVGLDYDYITPALIDADELRSYYAEVSRSIQAIDDTVAYFTNLQNQIDSLVTNCQDTGSVLSTISTLLEEFEYVPGEDAYIDSICNLSIDDLMSYLDNDYNNSLDSVLQLELDSMLDNYTNTSFSADGYSFRLSDCTGLTPQLLRDSGYVAYATTAGDSIYIYQSNNVFKFVDFTSNQFAIIEIDSTSNGMMRSPLRRYVDFYDRYLAQFVDLVGQLDMVKGTVENLWESKLVKAIAGTKAVKNVVNSINGAIPPQIKNGFGKIVETVKNGANAVENSKVWKTMTFGAKIGGFIDGFTKFLNCASTWREVYEMQSDIRAWDAAIDDIQAPCEKAENSAASLRSYAESAGENIANAYVQCIKTDIASLTLCFISKKNPLAGIPAVILNMGVYYAHQKMKTAFIDGSKAELAEVIERTNLLQKMCKEEEEEEEEVIEEVIIIYPYQSKYTIDPSGFVYEGVESNRLEGVTASCYYKETVEDMYGNLVDNVNLWDAEEYDQENPLLTDSMGMYQWFVPVGLWQVKLEKTGYETAYSDWLPVPPPQLDVNIGMVQNVQPTVVDAAATKTAVEFEFDKYMMTGYLDTSNIHVYQNGNYVQGTIEFVNAEQAYANPDSIYASAVRFVPNSHFAGGQLSLIVSNRVRSYSGIRMQETFVRTLTLQSQDYLFEENDSICQGDALTWHGKRYTVSGVYYDSLKTVDGMDSVYKLTLTVNPVVTTPVNITACANDELPEWAAGAVAGNTYHHYDTLVASTGCDSIIHTTLKVNPTYFDQQSVTWPSAAGNYNWHGKVISASGVYYDSLTTVITDCDSVFQLNITFADKYLFEEFHAICQGDYYDWRGQRYTQAGVYYDSLKTADQIDSIYKLTLTVSQNYFFTDVYAICQGETYRWHDMDFTAAGIYYDSLLSSTGCDSVYELTLTVNPTYLVEDSAELAEDGSGYIWHGKTYSVAGDYVDSLSTVFGCDSICILHLSDPIHSGIDETSRIIDVKVVPNPVKAGGTAYISADWTDEEIDGMTIEVITATGAVVSRITPETQTTAIGGIGLQGLYFIRITTGTDDVYVRKLIVK